MRSPTRGFTRRRHAISPIARGLSPAGVYVHFASKEDLLFSICERGHIIQQKKEILITYHTICITLSN